MNCMSRIVACNVCLLLNCNGLELSGTTDRTNVFFVASYRADVRQRRRGATGLEGPNWKAVATRSRVRELLDVIRQFVLYVLSLQATTSFVRQLFFCSAEASSRRSNSSNLRHFTT